MPKQYLNPKELFNSQQFGFSQIVTATSGTMVFISGQVAWDENQEMVGPGDFRAQVWQSLRNLETAMKVAGGALTDIVSLTIYIVEDQLSDTSPVKDGLLAFFPHDALPSSNWIGVPGLANEGFLVEFQAIAVIE